MIYYHAQNMNSVALYEHNTPFPAMNLYLKDVSEISYLWADARLPPGFVPLWIAKYFTHQEKKAHISWWNDGY